MTRNRQPETASGDANVPPGKNFVTERSDPCIR
jgi:hypothetical protein